MHERAAPTGNLRPVYGIFSLIALSAGFLCYYFFRDSNLIFYNIFNINITHNKLHLSNNVFSDFLKYNLCDGLWLLSGILLLRFIWFGNSRIGNYYITIFICAALLLELLQLTKYFSGTFDMLDIFTMVFFALLERCIYFYTKRRREAQKLGGNDILNLRVDENVTLIQTQIVTDGSSGKTTKTVTTRKVTYTGSALAIKYRN